jgi:hypothetical protein
MTNSRQHAAIAAKNHALRICHEEGIRPGSEVHEICLSQTIGALEWGELRLARSFASVAVDAQETCLRFGLPPRTESFRTCTDRESYAHGLLVPR